MNILLTGVSSFTGAWFASALAKAGHRVTATLRGTASAYQETRAARLTHVTQAGVTVLENCAFGDARFLAALSGTDILCHHGAEVKNYQSLDFDTLGAVASNTANARAVFERCATEKVKAFVASGSVFEPEEGLGEHPLRAFSPYGLSKGLSWQVQQFWARQTGVPIGKFVIPNPFGPLEEARFCAFLMRCWAKGETAEVRTPAYVRDNIPIDLLTRAYVNFVESMAHRPSGVKCAPSGYIETQGRFAERFAQEIGGRLNLATPLAFANQTDFPEPVMRTNADFDRAGWNEAGFWDAAATYYDTLYCKG